MHIFADNRDNLILLNRKYLFSLVYFTLHFVYKWNGIFCIHISTSCNTRNTPIQSTCISWQTNVNMRIGWLNALTQGFSAQKNVDTFHLNADEGHSWKDWQSTDNHRPQKLSVEVCSNYTPRWPHRHQKNRYCWDMVVKAASMKIWVKVYVVKSQSAHICFFSQ